MPEPCSGWGGPAEQAGRGPGCLSPGPGGAVLQSKSQGRSVCISPGFKTSPRAKEHKRNQECFNSLKDKFLQDVA